MRRTTLYVNEELALAIRQLAERQQRPQAQLIREALTRYLKHAQRQALRPEVPGIGAYRSGRSDVSVQAEKLLRDAAKAPR